MADHDSIMEKVRRFAGCDPDTADTELEMCYRAAVEWYKAADVAENPEDDLWLFWVCNLAAWMYDNRGNADPGASIPIFIVTSVHALRARGTTGAEAAGADGTDSAEAGTTGAEAGTTGTEAGTTGAEAGTDSAEAAGSGTDTAGSGDGEEGDGN